MCFLTPIHSTLSPDGNHKHEYAFLQIIKDQFYIPFSTTTVLFFIVIQVYLRGKHSSMAAISAKEKSTIIFFGCQVGFSSRSTFKTSDVESVSSFSGIKTATTMYPTLDRTQGKKSGNAYLY